MVQYKQNDFFKYYFTKQSPFNCGSRVSQSEDQKAFRCNILSSEDLLKLFQKLSMSPNKEVIKFLKILFLFFFSFFFCFCIHMKCVFTFLYYSAPFLLVNTIVFCQCNLFWDCVTGFVHFLMYIMILT